MFNIVGRGIGGNDKFESERVGDPEEVVGIASIDFAREDGVFRGPRAFAGTSSLRIPGKVRALDQLPDAGPEIPPIADHGDIGFIGLITARDPDRTIPVVAVQRMDSAAFGRLVNQEPVLAEISPFTLVFPGTEQGDSVPGHDGGSLVDSAPGTID